MLSVDNRSVSELLGQPCNQSDILVQLVDNLEQAVRMQLVDGVLTDLLYMGNKNSSNKSVLYYFCWKNF